MTDAVTEATLRSMLVNHWWRWNGCVRTGIRFKEDGTGELSYGLELAQFLAAVFEWKPLTDQDSAALDQSLPDDGADRDVPVHIQMTLTDRRIPGSGSLDERPTLQERNLTKAAFRPKEYTVKLERGKFPVIDEVATGLCLWYERHLQIEPSPYPPLEEWIQKMPIERHEPWKRTDFHRDSVDGDKYFDPRTGTTDVAKKERGDQIRVKLARQKEERAQRAANRED